MNYNKLVFVLRSKNRQKILLALNDMKLPSQLKKELKMEDSNIARALRELEHQGIIECLTPTQKMGRLYKLTSLGLTIKQHLTKNT